MDVDSGVGGCERMVRVKMIENGLCKMMLKSPRVVHPSLQYSVIMPLLPRRPDREWAWHERDRYREI